MKGKIKNYIKNFLVWLPLKNQNQGLRILMYHRVGEYNPLEIHSFVPPKLFKEQMDFLTINGYNVISLSSAHLYLKTESELPPRSLVLTFDDGYEDNFRFVYPVLKRLQLPATIFLIAQFVNKKNIVKGGDVYLNLDQIKEMSKSNFSFGSHTLSHRKLSRLNSEELWKEIYLSKVILQRILERKIDFICYPYGDYDQKVLQYVKVAGYCGGCTVRPGGNAPGKDLFRLRRLEITYKDEIEIFKHKLFGKYDLAHQAYQIYARAKGEIVWV